MLQFFRLIDEQADHMRSLIGDLLDQGRTVTGTLSVSPEPMEVSALVDQARSTFLSGGRGHAPSINLPEDPPQAMADRARIVQVLGNLLSNVRYRSSRKLREAFPLQAHAASATSKSSAILRCSLRLPARPKTWRIPSSPSHHAMVRSLQKPESPRTVIRTPGQRARIRSTTRFNSPSAPFAASIFERRTRTASTWLPQVM